MSLTLDLDEDLEAWIRSEAQRSGLDEMSFVKQTLERQRTLANSRPVAMPANEAELLRKINTGLPEHVWNEYRDLVAKRRAETLTESEYSRLITLSDQIEIDNAERVGLLIQLAQIRNVPLDDLMTQMGIKPREI
jgi:hypothetical protein